MLDVWIPFMPPTSNRIYRSFIKNGRIEVRLSDDAKRFKARAMQVIQQKGRTFLLQLQPNIPYELKVVVFFEELFNSGWPKKTENRYKRTDLSNRIKLIEDTVASAVGLDDSHNFRLTLEKQCDPQHPGLYVYLRETPETEVGLTKEAYDQLRSRQPQSNGTHSPLPLPRTAQRPPRVRPSPPRFPARGKGG